MKWYEHMSWVLKSRKAQATLIGLVSLFLARVLRMPPEEAAKLSTDIVYLVAVLIVGITAEDYATKSSGKPTVNMTVNPPEPDPLADAPPAPVVKVEVQTPPAGKTQ